MTAKKLAEMISGRKIGNEITRDEERMAADAGLAVVFGYSDDMMEFCGAIDDEIGCFDGGTTYIDKHGKIIDLGSFPGGYQGNLWQIEAVWHNFGGPAWTYETDIPHETFDIYEDGEIWCVGIVFSMEDVGK